MTVSGARTYDAYIVIVLTVLEDDDAVAVLTSLVLTLRSYLKDLISWSLSIHSISILV